MPVKDWSNYVVILYEDGHLYTGPKKWGTNDFNLKKHGKVKEIESQSTWNPKDKKWYPSNSSKSKKK